MNNTHRLTHQTQSSNLTQLNPHSYSATNNSHERTDHNNLRERNGSTSSNVHTSSGPSGRIMTLNNQQISGQPLSSENSNKNNNKTQTHRNFMSNLTHTENSNIRNNSYRRNLNSDEFLSFGQDKDIPQQLNIKSLGGKQDNKSGFQQSSTPTNLQAKQQNLLTQQSNFSTDSEKQQQRADYNSLYRNDIQNMNKQLHSQTSKQPTLLFSNRAADPQRKSQYRQEESTVPFNSCGGASIQPPINYNSSNWKDGFVMSSITYDRNSSSPNRFRSNVDNHNTNNQEYNSNQNHYLSVNSTSSRPISAINEAQKPISITYLNQVSQNKERQKQPSNISSKIINQKEQISSRQNIHNNTQNSQQNDQYGDNLNMGEKYQGNSAIQKFQIKQFNISKPDINNINNFSTQPKLMNITTQDQNRFSQTSTPIQGVTPNQQNQPSFTYFQPQRTQKTNINYQPPQNLGKAQDNLESSNNNNNTMKGHNFSLLPLSQKINKNQTLQQYTTNTNKNTLEDKLAVKVAQSRNQSQQQETQQQQQQIIKQNVQSKQNRSSPSKIVKLKVSQKQQQQYNPYQTLNSRHQPSSVHFNDSDLQNQNQKHQNSSETQKFQQKSHFLNSLGSNEAKSLFQRHKFSVDNIPLTSILDSGSKPLFTYQPLTSTDGNQKVSGSIDFSSTQPIGYQFKQQQQFNSNNLSNQQKSQNLETPIDQENQIILTPTDFYSGGANFLGYGLNRDGSLERENYSSLIIHDQKQQQNFLSQQIDQKSHRTISRTAANNFENQTKNKDSLSQANNNYFPQMNKTQYFAPPAGLLGNYNGDPQVHNNFSQATRSSFLQNPTTPLTASLISQGDMEQIIIGLHQKMKSLENKYLDLANYYKREMVKQKREHALDKDSENERERERNSKNRSKMGMSNGFDILTQQRQNNQMMSNSRSQDITNQQYNYAQAIERSISPIRIDNYIGLYSTTQNPQNQPSSNTLERELVNELMRDKQELEKALQNMLELQNQMQEKQSLLQTRLKSVEREKKLQTKSDNRAREQNNIQNYKSKEKKKEQAEVISAEQIIQIQEQLTQAIEKVENNLLIQTGSIYQQLSEGDIIDYFANLKIDVEKIIDSLKFSEVQNQQQLVRSLKSKRINSGSSSQLSLREQNKIAQNLDIDRHKRELNEYDMANEYNQQSLKKTVFEIQNNHNLSKLDIKKINISLSQIKKLTQELQTKNSGSTNYGLQSPKYTTSKSLEHMSQQIQLITGCTKSLNDKLQISDRMLEQLQESELQTFNNIKHLKSFTQNLIHQQSQINSQGLSLKLNNNAGIAQQSSRLDQIRSQSQSRSHSALQNYDTLKTQLKQLKNLNADLKDQLAIKSLDIEKLEGDNQMLSEKLNQLQNIPITVNVNQTNTFNKKIRNSHDIPSLLSQEQQQNQQMLLFENYPLNSFDNNKQNNEQKIIQPIIFEGEISRLRSENAGLINQIKSLNRTLDEKEAEIQKLGHEFEILGSGLQPQITSSNLKLNITQISGLYDLQSEKLRHLIKISSHFLHSMTKLQKAIQRKDYNVVSEKNEFESAKSDLKHLIKKTKKELDSENNEREFKKLIRLLLNQESSQLIASQKQTHYQIVEDDNEEEQKSHHLELSPIRVNQLNSNVFRLNNKNKNNMLVTNRSSSLGDRIFSSDGCSSLNNQPNLSSQLGQYQNKVPHNEKLFSNTLQQPFQKAQSYEQNPLQHNSQNSSSQFTTPVNQNKIQPNFQPPPDAGQIRHSSNTLKNKTRHYQSKEGRASSVEEDRAGISAIFQEGIVGLANLQPSHQYYKEQNENKSTSGVLYQSLEQSQLNEQKRGAKQKSQRGNQEEVSTSQLENFIRKLNSEITLLKQQIQEINQDKLNLQQSNEDLQNQNDELAIQNQNLDLQVNDLTQRFTNEKQHMEIDIKRLRDELEKQKSSSRAPSSQNTKSSKQLFSQQQQQHDDLDYQNLQIQYDSMLQKVKQISDQMDIVEKINQEYKKTITILEESGDQAQKNINTLIGKLEKKDSEIGELRDQLEATTSSKDRSDQQIQALLDQNQKLEHEKQLLQQHHQNLNQLLKAKTMSSLQIQTQAEEMVKEVDEELKREFQAMERNVQEKEQRVLGLESQLLDVVSQIESQIAKREEYEQLLKQFEERGIKVNALSQENYELKNEINTLRQDLERGELLQQETDQQIQQLQDQREGELQKLQNEFQEQINIMEEEHELNLEKLGDEYRNEIDELKQANLGVKNADFEQQLHALKDKELSDKLEQLKNSLNQEFNFKNQNLINNYEQQISQLKADQFQNLRMAQKQLQDQEQLQKAGKIELQRVIEKLREKQEELKEQNNEKEVKNQQLSLKIDQNTQLIEEQLAQINQLNERVDHMNIQVSEMQQEKQSLIDLHKIEVTKKEQFVVKQQIESSELIQSKDEALTQLQIQLDEQDLLIKQLQQNDQNTNHLFQNQNELLKTQIKQKDTLISDLKTQHQRLQSEKDQLQEQLQGYMDQLAHFKLENEHFTEHSKEIEEQNSERELQLLKENQDIKEQVRHLQNKIAELQNGIENQENFIQEKAKEQNVVLNELKASKQHLEAEIRQYKDIINDKEIKIDKIQGQVDALTEQNKIMQSQLTDTQTTLNQYQAQNQKFTETNNLLSNELESLKTSQLNDKSQYLSTIQSQDSQIKDLINNLNSKAQQIQNYQDQLKSKTKRISELLSDYKLLEQDCERLSEEKTTLNKQISTIESQKEQFQIEIADLKNQIAENEQINEQKQSLESNQENQQQQQLRDQIKLLKLQFEDKLAREIEINNVRGRELAMKNELVEDANKLIEEVQNEKINLRDRLRALMDLIDSDERRNGEFDQPISSASKPLLQNTLSPRLQTIPEEINEEHHQNQQDYFDVDVCLDRLESELRRTLTRNSTNLQNIKTQSQQQLQEKDQQIAQQKQEMLLLQQDLAHKCEDLTLQLQAAISKLDINDKDFRNQLEIASRKVQNYRDKVIQKQKQINGLEQEKRELQQSKVDMMQSRITSPVNNSIREIELLQRLQKAEAELQTYRLAGLQQNQMGSQGKKRVNDSNDEEGQSIEVDMSRIEQMEDQLKTLRTQLFAAREQVVQRLTETFGKQIKDMAKSYANEKILIHKLNQLSTDEQVQVLNNQYKVVKILEINYPHSSTSGQSKSTLNKDTTENSNLFIIQHSISKELSVIDTSKLSASTLQYLITFLPANKAQVDLITLQPLDSQQERQLQQLEEKILEIREERQELQQELAIYKNKLLSGNGFEGVDLEMIEREDDIESLNDKNQQMKIKIKELLEDNLMMKHRIIEMNELISQISSSFQGGKDKQPLQESNLVLKLRDENDNLRYQLSQLEQNNEELQAQIEQLQQLNQPASTSLKHSVRDGQSLVINTVGQSGITQNLNPDDLFRRQNQILAQFTNQEINERSFFDGLQINGGAGLINNNDSQNQQQNDNMFDQSSLYGAILQGIEGGNPANDIVEGSENAQNTADFDALKNENQQMKIQIYDLQSKLSKLEMENAEFGQIINQLREEIKQKEQQLLLTPDSSIVLSNIKATLMQYLRSCPLSDKNSEQLLEVVMSQIGFTREEVEDLKSIRRRGRDGSLSGTLGDTNQNNQDDTGSRSRKAVTNAIGMFGNLLRKKDGGSKEVSQVRQNNQISPSPMRPLQRK